MTRPAMAGYQLVGVVWRWTPTIGKAVAADTRSTAVQWLMLGGWLWLVPVRAVARRVTSRADPAGPRDALSSILARVDVGTGPSNVPGEISHRFFSGAWSEEAGCITSVCGSRLRVEDRRFP